jgi:phosphopantothenoylcysteine synthetase/decarboxylase
MASLRTATQEKIDAVSNISNKTRGRMKSVIVMDFYVGVSSRLELLHASGRSNVLNAVAKGSFIHHGTTTARLLATLRLH